jgi:hypothetical protein
MRTRPDLATDVYGECADVGAGGTGYANSDLGFGIWDFVGQTFER